MPGGRTMDPLDFNAAKLGLKDLELLRPTSPGQLILGRMHINAFEARTMLARERKAKFVLMWMMARYYFDYPWRSKTRRDRRLTGGQALLGGLFTALRKRGVTLWLNTPMVSLTQDGARVSGVVVRRDGHDVTVRARRAGRLYAALHLALFLHPLRRLGRRRGARTAC